MTAIFQNAVLVVGGVFVCVMLLLGALLVGIGLFALQRFRAAAGWPQVPGRIEKSEVVPERHFEGDQFFNPVVTYLYSAPGGTFSGHKLATTGRLFPKEAAARRVVDRFPIGTTVMVRYNPDDPSESVVERGVSGGVWFILFGLSCWIFPVLAALHVGLSWRLIAAVLGGLVLIPTLLFLRSGSTLQKARKKGLLPPEGTASDADVAALLARGEKLLAIHLYRELHGGGLKNAREAVESIGHDSRRPGE